MDGFSNNKSIERLEIKDNPIADDNNDAGIKAIIGLIE